MSKTFDQIPLERPATPLLDRAATPEDLRCLDEQDLLQLADELRETLLYSVGKTGGHFGAGLGVIELTVALHYAYHTPQDRLVWDVGHQCYPHKILTGRREELLNIRRSGGLSGFPKRSESEYDTFGVGHSSTSISAALGMALLVHGLIFALLAWIVLDVLDDSVPELVVESAQGESDIPVQKKEFTQKMQQKPSTAK